MGTVTYLGMPDVQKYRHYQSNEVIDIWHITSNHYRYVDKLINIKVSIHCYNRYFYINRNIDISKGD